MSTTGDTDDPPEGFARMTNRAALEKIVGPFYERATADGARQLGFRVTANKLNRMGVCHGGLLALFADLQGGPVKRLLGLEGDSPTVNLGIDFVAPVPAGAWVHSQPQLVRRTRGMLFFEAKFFADGELCARISGIYRLKSQNSERGATSSPASA